MGIGRGATESGIGVAFWACTHKTGAGNPRWGDDAKGLSFQSPVSAAAILNKQSSNVSQVCTAHCETRAPARTLR
jgi:hypothetical protein